MSKEPLTPEVGPWAKEKLERLRQYLDAYTKILLGLKNKKYINGYVYIDAFAGTTMAKIRTKKQTKQEKDTLLLFELPEDAEYIKGSPKIALDLERPFTQYVFVELDKKRVKELERLKKDYPDKDIKIYADDCNEYLQDLLKKKVQWNKWRVFVFLDPYGAHVPWETVAALAAAKSFEVLINFPWTAITRMANNNSLMLDRNKELLDLYFGTTEWFDVMYEKKTDWISDKVHKRPEAVELVLDWYTKRLKETFGFVSTPRPINDTKGRLLYYLIWAGRHPKGHEVAEYILGRDDYKPQKKLL